MWDQALASLRIETYKTYGGTDTMMIRLSRACGLKQLDRDNQKYQKMIRLSRACGLKHECFAKGIDCNEDQALASLRIETI